MITRRIIPCLDCRDGLVVKGVRFAALRNIGNPVELAQRYANDGADELVVLDITATKENRPPDETLISAIRKVLSIPLTVGGGIESAEDVASALGAGADKVSINTAAIRRPELIREASQRFGSQCVVLAIDAERSGDSWRVRVRSGEQPVARDALEWAEEAALLGAGEILLTSFDRDGTGDGYDQELLEAMSTRVSIPIIASGGARDCESLLRAFASGASAVLAATIFHDNQISIPRAKEFLKQQGVRVRL